MLVCGTEAVKEVKYLIHDPIRSGARAINLVDHHNWLQAALKGLTGHKAGLRHRAVHRIHQQANAVHHGKNALYLTAKVGVSGGIDDIDAIVLPLDGGILGENGNTPLFFLVVRVHYALRGQVFAVKGAGLPQELVDQCGFTVIDVGDDGNVAQFLYHKNEPQEWAAVIPLWGDCIKGAHYSGTCSQAIAGLVG